LPNKSTDRHTNESEIQDDRFLNTTRKRRIRGVEAGEE
jgi:hypothetical protein